MYCVAILESLALVNALRTLQFTPQPELYLSLHCSIEHAQCNDKQVLSIQLSSRSARKIIPLLNSKRWITPHQIRVARCKQSGTSKP